MKKQSVLESRLAASVSKLIAAACVTWLGASLESAQSMSDAAGAAVAAAISLGVLMLVDKVQSKVISSHKNRADKSDELFSRVVLAIDEAKDNAGSTHFDDDDTRTVLHSVMGSDAREKVREVRKKQGLANE